MIHDDNDVSCLWFIMMIYESWIILWFWWFIFMILNIFDSLVVIATNESEIWTLESYCDCSISIVFVLDDDGSRRYGSEPKLAQMTSLQLSYQFIITSSHQRLSFTYLPFSRNALYFGYNRNANSLWWKSAGRVSSGGQMCLFTYIVVHSYLQLHDSIEGPARRWYPNLLLPACKIGLPDVRFEPDWYCGYLSGEKNEVASDMYVKYISCFFLHFVLHLHWCPESEWHGGPSARANNRISKVWISWDVGTCCLPRRSMVQRYTTDLRVLESIRWRTSAVRPSGTCPMVSNSWCRWILYLQNNF